MGLKTKIDFSKFKRIITKNNLPLIGNEIKADIIKRTQSSKDVNLKSFRKYSKEYKEIKKKEYGSSNVNLTRDQKMLNSITWKKILGGIRLYFNSAEQTKKAYKNQVKYKRKFFGIDKKQIQKIEEKLINLYKNKIFML